MNIKLLKQAALPILGLGAWVVAAIIPLIAHSLADGAQDLWQVQPYADKNTIRLAQSDFNAAKPTDPDYDKKVLALYGQPADAKDKFIVSASSIQRPKEKPELAFLLVDKTKGENPWQAKTVLFLAKVMKGGAVITGALFLVFWLFMQWAAPAKGARLASAE